MSRIAIFLAAAALMAGCRRHDDDEDIIFQPGMDWYVIYANGHPLAAETTNAAFLAKEDDLLTFINDHRVSVGLAPLFPETAMEDLARAHSIHEALGHFTGSINPEGHDPGDRADIVGIAWSRFAENISYDWEFADDAYFEMLNHPGMHDTIDDPGFTSIGVGYEHDPGSDWLDYWTVEFREP